MHTGRVIKYLRERAGMTQAELGKILGVNKSTIQKYENGMVQNLKIKTIRKLSEIFIVPSWYFIFPEKLTFIDEETAMMRLQHILVLAIMYDQLTEEGQKRVYMYLKDILEISRYRRQMTSENLADEIQHLKEMLIGIQYPFDREKYETIKLWPTDDRAPSPESDGS